MDQFEPLDAGCQLEVTDNRKMQLKNILRLLFYLSLPLLLYVYLYLFSPLVIQRINMFVLKYAHGRIFNYYRQLRPVSVLLFYLMIWAVLKKYQFISLERQQKMDCYSEYVLIKGMPLFFSIAIAVAFCTWVPHYLYWPWWMDLDHFAVSAQSWDAGVIPYRDLIDFNFPGPIYFLWLVGKIFGWGRPMLVNACDVLVVLGLGGVLIFWSRQLFRSPMAGLFGVFLVIRYYFSLDYSRVMQRDWYVVCLAIAAICTVQISKIKYRWIVAAFMFAMALNIRPYAVLMLPPLFYCLWLDSFQDGKFRLSVIRQFVTGSIVFTALLWLPLYLTGNFDDFLKHFIGALIQDSYKRPNRRSFMTLMRHQLDTKIIFLGLIALVVNFISARKDKSLLRLNMTWLIAYVSFLNYMVICPVRHAYTEIPMEIMAGVVAGIGFQTFWNTTSFSHFYRLIVILFWFIYYFPGQPEYCQFEPSARAIVSFVKWDDLKQSPPGSSGILKDTQAPQSDSYSWQDYQEVLKFIRNETTPDTRVGNFLRTHPFPALNGMTGRLTLWPVGEGILWLHSVNRDLEPRFAKSLNQPSPAMIVWIADGEPGAIYKFPLIESVIRERYEPFKKFGRFDVWRKKETQP